MKSLPLCVIVVFLVWLDKLACNNSDINKGAIGEQPGSDWEENTVIAYQLLEIYEK